MINFLANNWGSLIVGAVILAVAALIIAGIRKRRKSPCPPGCAGCPSAGSCNSGKNSNSVT